MSRRGKRDHDWVAASGLSSLDELARVVVERAGERGRLEPRVVARHLKNMNRAWLMDHASVLAALSDVTHIEPSALLAAEGAVFVLGSLEVRAFDAATESPAQLLDESPLSWLNESGVSVAHVPPGAGLTLWAHVTARRKLAEVVRGVSLRSVLPQIMTMPVGVRALALVDELNLGDANERNGLERLCDTARSTLVLSHRVLPSELPAHATMRRWEFVAGWQGLLREWLLKRQSARLRVAVQRGIRETAACDNIIETPRDLIELAAVFAATRDLDLQNATLGDTEILRALIRRRRGPPPLTSRGVERLASALQGATRSRLVELQLNLFGPLSRDAWSTLLSDADVGVAERLGLLRRVAENLRAWPEHLHRGSVRVHATQLLRTGAGWGALCVDGDRRAVIDDALDRCELSELEKLIDTAVAVGAPTSLDLCGRREALFSAVARRCESDGPLPAEPKLHALLEATLGGLSHRYTDPAFPAAPLTRPSIESGANNFDFIADCWAWSLRIRQPHFRRDLDQGLFPGWTKLSWSSLPKWWSSAAPALDAEPPSGFLRLLRDAEHLVVRIDGEPGPAAPPLLLPFILDKMPLRSELCRRLFSYPWAAKRAAAADAQRVWSLAVAQFGVAQAEPWMKLAGQTSPPVDLDGVVAAVDDATLMSVRWTTQPDWLRDAAFRRLAQNPANWDSLLSQLDSSLLAPQHAALLTEMLSAPQGARAARLLWRATPDLARELLATVRDVDATRFERLVFSAPRDELAGVLTIVEQSPRTDEIDCWLRRTLLAHPAVAVDAFRVLTTWAPSP